ncbi:hypothetical protein FJW04_10225 [Mesorhizobium sp. B2-7-3]|uniref:hypothetical protein n=1 Tax=Mesorhizobium sp. B2-7-3 TaxID=2589907 RepID=UPI001127AB4B|nr:hypothetical protein [Mesorhizobium sp. B2-7-3]TPJ17891.1 hypothetical protein FJW04_10225 [Mesorhizobium sp. B2-7-3]
MTQSRNRAFDLTAVIDKLHPTTHKDLIRAIRAFHAVESVVLDLRDAAESVELLQKIGHEASDRTSSLGRALLVHAVVVYSRATHTKAIHRFKVGVTSGYNEALKAKHNEITNLRDKCIAHFGPGKDLWHDERVIYVEKALENGLQLVHRRTNFSRKAINDLDSLLTAAIGRGKELERARAIDLGSILTGADNETWALIDQHEFDIVGFFEANDLKVKVWEEGSFAQNLWETKRRPIG